LGTAFGTCECEDINPNDCVTNADCADSPLVPASCQRVECNTDIKQCALAWDAAGDSCDDGDACTVDDLCGADGCKGAAMLCDDADPCTVDSCEAGACRAAPGNNGATCSDDDACTVDDQCVDGSCAGSPKNCDLKECEISTCEAGECVAVGPNAGIPCDDDDPCTADDSCSNDGECAGLAVTCDDGNSCTVDACSPLDGSCVNNPAADGGKCSDDGDPCTLDTCTAGQCNTALSNGSECDDGDACTQNTNCAADQCTGGEAIGCDDGNECTVDSCDSQLGCVNQPSAPVACDDGDNCTTNGQCVDGSCVGNALCDDGCALTADSCLDGVCSITWDESCGNGVLDDGEQCDPGWFESVTWGGAVWSCADENQGSQLGYGCDSQCQFQQFGVQKVAGFEDQIIEAASGDLFAQGSSVLVWRAETANNSSIDQPCAPGLKCADDYLCIKGTCYKQRRVYGTVFTASAQPLMVSLGGLSAFQPSEGAQSYPMGVPVVAVAPNQDIFAVAYLSERIEDSGVNGYTVRTYAVDHEAQTISPMNIVERDFGDAQMTHLDLAWSSNGQKLAVLHNRKGEVTNFGYTESWHEITEYDADLALLTPENDSYSLTSAIVLLSGGAYTSAAVTEEGRIVYRSDGKMMLLAQGVHGDDIWAFRAANNAIEQAKKLPVKVGDFKSKMTLTMSKLPPMVAVPGSKDVMIAWPTNMGSKKSVMWRRYNFTFLAVAGGSLLTGAISDELSISTTGSNAFFLRWNTSAGAQAVWLDKSGPLGEVQALESNLPGVNRSNGNGKLLLMDGADSLIKSQL
jgi:hypothetical protein